MEGLVMIQYEDAYRHRRVLVTGDSGFKGSWLTQWLVDLGAEVYGLSLPPEGKPNHCELLNLKAAADRGDIRDYSQVSRVFEAAKPQIVFHMAAQPLVRRSYREPLTTWSTNVLGTANVLEACRNQPNVQAVVVITTDKVYQNNEWVWGYRECDRLGGHDPYSASKACSEIVVSSFRESFFEKRPLVASVRAGNVIGGGDWAEDRLIPDVVRATVGRRPLEIRSPNATRPWQHVLECLSGYLMIGQRLLAGDERFADAWNFGPDPVDNRRVSAVLHEMNLHWPELSWSVTATPQPHEANLLYLDNSKAKSSLGWKPVWPLAIALEKTAIWYRAYYESETVLTKKQLDEYVQAAMELECPWVR